MHNIFSYVHSYDFKTFMVSFKNFHMAYYKSYTPHIATVILILKVCAHQVKRVV